MKPVIRRNGGFTLVELLVVVAIIALLISILLPSLRGARDQAKILICRNNLRSIWTGILTYAYEYNDRIPYLESVNTTDPEADPFDPAHPETVGNVLLKYVNPDSWRCPSAVNGYPKSAGPGKWKMTYTFSTADRFFSPTPYDKHRYAYTKGLNDPAIQNYIHFDGRPLRLLDGRRYVSSPQPHGNENEKGYWKVRFPIISDMLSGAIVQGHPNYPHRGVMSPRNDLGNAKEDFEKSTGAAGGKLPGYHELHADGDKVEVFMTRFWLASVQPGTGQ